MARKPIITPAVQKGPDFVGATPADMAEQEANARTMQNETADNATALAEQLGYLGALTVGALEDEIRHFRGRAAEASFEMGRRLLILREMTPHGEFQQRVDSMEINYAFANRVMKIARKFSKVIAPQLLKAANSQAKLLELLVLDDSEIEELEAGETVRNLHVSKIETMSYREMKAALLAKDEEIAIKERQISAKDSKINELDAKLNHKPVHTYDALGREIPDESPEEKSIELREEATQEAFNIEAALMGSLRPVIAELLEYGAKHGQLHEDFLVGLLCQIETSISQIRGQFQLKDKPDGDDLPEWMRPGFDAQAAANGQAN